MMVDGLGWIWKRWVITQVDETKSYFLKDCAPQKIEFTVKLQSYGCDAGRLASFIGRAAVMAQYRTRRFITYNMSWFFDDASWRHHDFGYSVGGDRWDRARCDWKFLRAMWRDALSQSHFWMVPVALLLALVFYLAVRIGGQFGSFNYSPRYATLDEIMAPYGPYWRLMGIMEPDWYQANVIGGTVQIYDSWDESEWLLWDDNRPEGEQRLLRTGTPDLSQAIKRANAWLEENGLILPVTKKEKTS